MDPKAQRYCPA